MSITFTPAAGTWTTYSYYACDPEQICPLDDHANGVVRVKDDEPSINMANGNAYHFFAVIGHPLPDCCGEFTVEQLIAIKAACYELKRSFNAQSEQMEHYTNTFIQIADHCVYHNCSVSYG